MMTGIILPSDVFVSNGPELPIIIVGKIFRSFKNEDQDKAYPYYFIVVYSNGIKVPFIYDTYKNADKDRKALIDAIRFSESKVN